MRRRANPDNTWAALVFWATFHDTCATLAQLREDDGVHLYMGFEMDAPPTPDIRPEREVELILSILGAYLLPEDERPPWGITMAGWEAYAFHPDYQVREAVAKHPYRFLDYCYSPARQKVAAAA